MPKSFLLFLYFCVAPNIASLAQTLSWTEVRQAVIDFHPYAQRATLIQDMAVADLLKAKGGFDLKTFANYTAKNFNDKNYFNHLDAGVKWPTRLGLELKSGYQYANGSFVNPENNLPANGQAYFGFNWSVGQGLLTDDRRTQLSIATTGLKLAQSESQLVMTDLIFGAAKSYWGWVGAENQVAVIQAALDQAFIRHRALIESFLQGEKPAIDTVESYILVQNREIDLNFAKTDRQNALLELQQFIQTAQFPPANFKAPGIDLVPMLPLALSADSLSTDALNKHPAIRYYQSKNAQLQAEQRLKREFMKPVVDLQYNLLGSGWQFFPTATESGPSVLANDIKWGVQFAFPITNRKAKGDLMATQLKKEQNLLQLQQKSIEIDNKIRQYANELANLNRQIVQFRSITAGYKQLLDAENEKFVLGESSVFLINTREQRWIDAQVKLVKLLAEYKKVEAGLLWATATN